MPIFDEIGYDLLTIGNHELYMSEVSYEMFNIWVKKWGERYMNSNVKVLNKTSGKYECVGATHRYFKTEKGLCVMAFGILFDFTGNSNASQVIKAKDMTKEPWFTQALATSEPIDVIVLLGHIPVSQNAPESKLKVVCAPQMWCASCVAFDNPSNIFLGVIVPAVSTIVINKEHEHKSRITVL